MCGIAGYVQLDGTPADRAILKAMCDAVIHRGPDAEGLMVEGPVALGMRRLSIIDVAGGDQPIHNADRTISVVYNGETYNFRDLRADLEDQGHAFSTNTDTEVTVHLYQEHGVEGLDRLRGMYGLALYDRGPRRLVLVRDRMGQKPLHWWCDGEVFVFGSEIKSILVGLSRLGRGRPAVNRRALVDYMGYGYVPDPHTAFEGIHKLPPAHRLVLEGGEVTLERYWSPDWHPVEEGDEEEHLDQMESLLEESVRMRLMSDVPLGAFLSGGIDSSTVVGLMARCSEMPIKTFSIGFEDQEYDELQHARTVAEHLGTDHRELVVKPDAAELIGDIVKHFDEPFADSSAIPTYYVSRMAREQVTVVLSGDGGDELFAGYQRYLNTAPGWRNSMPLAMRKALFGSIARMLPTGFTGRSALHNMGLDEDARYIHHLTCGVSEWHRELYQDDFAASVDTTDPSGPYAGRLEEMGWADETTRRMYADTQIYLPGDILTKVDRMSMMVSLEARSPLLDHRFVELAAALPVGLKFRGGVTKHLLRRLARKLVPPEVIDRRKQGFAVPISRWFNRQWLETSNDLVIGGRAASRGIFRPECLERLLQEHRSGRRDHGQVLWQLMVLELWFRAYEDESAFS